MVAATAESVIDSQRALEGDAYHGVIRLGGSAHVPSTAHPPRSFATCVHTYRHVCRDSMYVYARAQLLFVHISFVQHVYVHSKRARARLGITQQCHTHIRQRIAYHSRVRATAFVPWRKCESPGCCLLVGWLVGRLVGWCVGVVGTPPSPTHNT